jgi:hypothetical protein
VDVLDADAPGASARLVLSCVVGPEAFVRESTPRVGVPEVEDARVKGGVGDSVDEDDAVSTRSESASGVGIGGYERGSMRTRATSKGTGASLASLALSSRPLVETVTLRAFVASPTRTSGSDLIFVTGGSIVGSVTVSGVCVGQASV